MELYITYNEISCRNATTNLSQLATSLEFNSLINVNCGKSRAEDTLVTHGQGWGYEKI